MVTKVVDLIEKKNFLHFYELIDYAMDNDERLLEYVSSEKGTLFCSAYLDSKRNSLCGNLRYETIDTKTVPPEENKLKPII